MAVSREYLDYILEQLAGLGRVRARRMFGGAGLYSEAAFFAIITDDTLYLRADETTRAQFTARGMPAFRPYADRPQVSMSYYAAPAEVLEDAQELVSWARRAVAVALKTPRVARRGRPRRATRT